MAWLLIIAVLSFCALVLLLLREGYFNKFLIKFGLKEQRAGINWAVFSWSSCLQKLNYQADIVFLGDSITRGGNFHETFQDKKIINLGCSGDTLGGLVNRIPMVVAVSPKKVFLLCGINGLTDFNVKKCVKKYDELISGLKKSLPETDFYIQSLLPISVSKEKTSMCHNTSIRRFNEYLQIMAKKHGLIYVDLYSLYALNGHMNPQLTVDGLHLKPDAYSLWEKCIENYIK